MVQHPQAPYTFKLKMLFEFLVDFRAIHQTITELANGVPAAASMHNTSPINARR
jgi:hypothetical protein